ncbi:hypothetical protein PHET_00848 [Paragonimus heterotremus]|uniref:Uncharacterized protein n=1 Tax=Paragonimus heterotremus TaxID=100268 RepID=A0A8J4T677_9TREM|nr:hypothetical protein PHET_00848 [Paragonimus heterotremus]
MLFHPARQHRVLIQTSVFCWLLILIHYHNLSFNVSANISVDLALLLTHTITLDVPWFPRTNTANCPTTFNRSARLVIREPKPMPATILIPGIPTELISQLPTSMFLHLVPFPRLYPGRSLLFSRVDKISRLRFAIGLNQWGEIGEEMELWIHHSELYRALPDRHNEFAHTTGGIVRSTGLVVVPLPKHRHIRKLAPLMLIVELTNHSVKVLTGCTKKSQLVYNITYRQMSELEASHKYRLVTSLPENDWLFLLSGGPLHDDRFKVRISQTSV